MRAVQASRERPTAFARNLFAGLPARYDVLVDLLSFGQNRRWRATMVDSVAASAPRSVLDVATGTAGVALLLTERTGAGVVGLDVTEQMLRQARRRIAAAGRQDRIRLVAGRAEQLPFADEQFDAVTFTYLLRYVADPAATLAELARVLRRGGVLASLEFAVPRAPWWHAGWLLYTRVLLPFAGLLTGGPQWWRVGRFLGASISTHYRRYPVQWTVRAWQEAGLADVEAHRMSLGGGLVMAGHRR